MAENETESYVRVSKKESVEQAIELLRSSSKSAKRKRNERPEESSKILSSCQTNLLSKRASNAALVFSENYALNEMRSCLVHGDWVSLQDLFPLLLNCHSEFEPIVWRYALTILLCSPESDASHLREFFELCIGAQDADESHLLKRLLTLRDKN